MSPDEIKLRMKEKGIRQVDLCREWKKPPVTVSRIVNKSLQSRELEKKLARKLGVTLAKFRENSSNGGTP